jgi:hypothetical protein
MTIIPNRTIVQLPTKRYQSLSVKRIALPFSKLFGREIAQEVEAIVFPDVSFAFAEVSGEWEITCAIKFLTRRWRGKFIVIEITSPS